MRRLWRHTRTFQELIRQDDEYDENKLLFWVICNILLHLSLIDIYGSKVHLYLLRIQDALVNFIIIAHDTGFHFFPHF